jgi:hypothetical protein
LISILIVLMMKINHNLSLRRPKFPHGWWKFGPISRKRER